MNMKRNIYKLWSRTKQGLLVLASSALLSTAYSQTTTFVYTGTVQTITLPAGNYSIECWGGNGGTAANTGSTSVLVGGKGGYSRGFFNNPSTQVFNVYVGGRGGDATGANIGSGGGGMSDVAPASNTLAVVIAAGGGGGSTSGSTSSENSTGGDAGGLIGATALDNTGVTGGSAATGGSQSAGGSATAGTYGVGFPGGFGYGGGGANGGVSGTMHGPGGAGGNGGNGGWNGGGGGCTLTGINDHAAGGGAGYYGGGGGRGDGGAGGGGSSYIGGVTTATTIMFGQSGYVTNPDVAGNGRVIITSLCNLNMVSSAAPGPICVGGSATLTSDAISNYSWSNGSTAATIVVSPTVTTQYTLTATSPLNCTTSAVVTVSVISSPPSITAVTSNTAVCAGGAVVLTASGAATYTWTNGVTNAVSYTPAATNVYTVTGTNACGTGSASIGVTVNPSPSVFAGVNTPTVCSGSSVTFTSGGSATSYFWSAGVVSGTPYFPGSTSVYTLTGTSAGCSSVALVGVTVVASPNAPPAVTPTAICVGSTATLSATGANSYTWTPGNNIFTSTVAVSPPGPTTYTIVRQNGACTTTATVSLVVNPLPLVNASASPNQICTGTGVNFVVVGPISNTWMPGGFTQSNFTLFPNNSTCYTVTGSNGNCTASAVVCVTVNASPAISILSSTNVICQGGTVSFTASGNATAYNWQPMNSSNINETLSPSTTTIVSLSGTNTAGCTSTVTQLIQVNPLANLTLTTSLPFVCAGQTAVISVLNPSPNIVYNWNTGPTGPSISVSPTITTNYGIVGTNTVSGCVNTNSISLAVYISTFSIASPSAICKGETATLTAAGSPTSYAWNVPGSPTAPSVTVNPIVNTTYIATGTNGSCSNTVAVTVTVNPLPNVTATVAKSQICKFEIATITGNGATTYSWNTGATSQVLTFTLSVTTTYTLTGTDNNNCSKTTTVTQFVATCIGIDDIDREGRNINIYPNPNNGTFMIDSDQNMTLEVINALGKTVTTVQLQAGSSKEVTVGDLPAGVYFIRSQTDGSKINKKLIIER